MSGVAGRRAGGAGRRGSGWRRRAPVLFLGLSLAVAGFGALEAYRAERSHRAAAAGVLTDYADFAARSFERRVTELLGQRFTNTFSIARNNAIFARGEATQQCLMQLLDPTGPNQCACAPTRLAGRWSYFEHVGAAPVDRQWSGTLPDPGVQEAVLEATRNHARERYENGWGFALVQVEHGPLVAYTRLISSTRLNGRLSPTADTLVYGVEVDTAQLAGLYRWVLEKDDLLPASLVGDGPAGDVVQVEVLDDWGRVAFASRPGAEHLYPVELEGRAALGGGVVRASIVPDMADQLVIGGLPGDRTPILQLIVIMAAALAVVSIVQLRREDHFAHLRQDFVASVSHELRTPLAQVRLFTETLRLGRAPTAEHRAWALESIDRETVRLAHLVENILHFSRAERGVLAAERELVDLSEDVRQAVEAFRPLLPEAKGRIETVASGTLMAEVHRDSIRQVLLNYLDNAVRYGASGQTIRVEASRAAGQVRITVDDEGAGVAAAERERIFEPFHRGACPEGSAVAGSGIGLSVVREIAVSHDGGAWVEDAPGGGARFVFAVPAVETARPEHFGVSSASRAPWSTGAA